MGFLSKVTAGLGTLAGGLIGGGLSLTGDILSNKTNRKLARDARDYDYQMWLKSNEYNSPVSQMSRLKEAGLNPNLVYGSGSVSGNTSSPVPKAPVAHVDSVTRNLNLLQTVMGTLSMYNDLRVKDASVAKDQASSNLLWQKVQSEQENTNYLRSKANAMETDYWYKVYRNTAEGYRFNLGKDYFNRLYMAELIRKERLNDLAAQQREINRSNISLAGSNAYLRSYDADIVRSMQGTNLRLTDPVYARLFMGLVRILNRIK